MEEEEEDEEEEESLHYRPEHAEVRYGGDISGHVDPEAQTEP